MGAGIFALGVGAALTTGGAGGDASADSTGTSHSGGVAHHQKRASAPSTPSRTTKPKNRTTVAGGVRAKAVVDNPLTEQDKSIAEQDKAIAAQEKAFDNNARIAVFNFATLPPEVNSSRLYSGSSATAMLDAADAWNNLANGLNGAAQGFDRASQGLNSATWAGPVSAAMSNAASAIPDG